MCLKRSKSAPTCLLGLLLLLPIAVPVAAQTVSCSGVPAWNATTIYNPGDRVVHRGELYEALIQIWNAPPDHCPSCGWYSHLGTCGGGGDTIPPSVPGGLSSPSRTSTSISLSWNASTDTGGSGVAGYDVFRDGSAVGSASATSFTDSGLSPAATHSYRVRARDGAGNLSALSSAISVTTAPPAECTTQPSTPANLRSPSQTTTAVSLAWDASSPGPNCTVQYRVFRNSVQVTQISATSTTVGELSPATTYTFAVSAINEFGMSALSNALEVRTADDTPPPPPPPASDRLLIGYWHNFENGSGFIQLHDVSLDWDIVNVAFAESQAGSSSRMQFIPDLRTSQSQIIADIQTLNARGQRVQISIGGANSVVQLNTATDRNNFIDTMSSIISTYGFNGLDIDLEGSSLSLDSGDTDFRDPTTPRIANLISGVRELRNRFGSDFSITMAPETFFVQVGFEVYGGSAGAYLPVIHGLRDILNVLHVQHYNTGSVRALDGRAYGSATADFHVAMAEMLLQGFPVGGIPFPPLRQDQVAIGVPASPEAAGSGFTSVPVLQDALDRLITGAPHSGIYEPINPNGYPGFRGLMTWSINWDRFNGFEFSSSHRPFLDSR